MKKVLAFDVYGTLIDPHGVVALLQTMIGAQAASFSSLWRNKQLEYTFRRAAMGGGDQYRDFAVCTQAALDYADQVMQTALSDTRKASLLSAYGELPAFAEVATSLQQLAAGGYDCWAFSNGTPDGIAGVLAHAAIDQHLAGVFSVNQVGSFKPAPDVYSAFARQHARDQALACGLRVDFQ